MKKRKYEKTKEKEETTVTVQSETDFSDIFVFHNLPPVFPILNTISSLTIKQLQWLGVANIAARTAENSNTFAGRLTLFQDNWLKICTDPWVLSTIQGYQTEWYSQPVQDRESPCLHFSREETESLQEEITLMLK